MRGVSHEMATLARDKSVIATQDFFSLSAAFNGFAKNI